MLEGALYVAGGNDGTSCLNSVERYSTKAGAWESVAPMNIRRCIRPGVGGEWFCHYIWFTPGALLQGWCTQHLSSAGGPWVPPGHPVLLS